MKFLALFVLAAATALPAAPEYPTMGPDIYDPQADGARQIEAALAQAKSGHKRVLVDFGANWCIWCRRLHRMFEEDPAVGRALHENYVLVLVDVNARNGTHRNAAVVGRYGNPLRHGVPVLVVLDADGRQLTTQSSDPLGDDAGYNPAKVTAFLKAWAP